MKSFRKLFGILVLAVGAASIFVRPFGNVKAADGQAPLLHGVQLQPPVLSVLQRSCQDCHSERTVWPWYSYLAPVSWLIEKDVRDGRSRFNMSRWDQYGPSEQSQVLAAISVEVRNRHMPPSKYTALHPTARLSDQEVQLLDQWGHQERRRLKEARSQNNGAPGEAAATVQGTR